MKSDLIADMISKVICKYEKEQLCFFITEDGMIQEEELEAVLRACLQGRYL